MKIKAVVFDIGNVLLRFDFAPAFKELGIAGVDLLGGRGDWEKLKHSYECGSINRAHFLDQATSLLKYTGGLEKFTSIWLEIFSLNEPMWELVQQWQKVVPLYLLSNTNDMHVEYFTQQFPGFSCFKDAVYSHEAKLMKPDPAIFTLAAKQFGIEPSTALYIDDLPANVDAAAQAGFIAVEYCPDQHPEFLEKLKNAGIDSDFASN